MKIKSVRIQNFRSLKDQTVDFDSYTCLVGANGSGKSNVLHALNVFFGELDIPGLDSRILGEEDFHIKNIGDPIEITVTFSDLSPEARRELAHYVRHDQLVVSVQARFNAASGNAEVKQYGRRMVIKDFAPFFAAEKEGKKVGELKEIYNKAREKYSDLPAPGPKDGMIQSLRSYEEEHPQLCEELPSGDEFYGVAKGKNLLEKYIQWVFMPAVKDASSEQAETKTTALGKLLARTVRSRVNFKDSIDAIRKEMQEKYGKLLADSQEQLGEISKALRDRLTEWAHQDATLRLKWHQPDKAVRVDEPFAQAILGEAGFEGEIAHFGHGLQRSFLLAVLQELSGSDINAGPRLILACEEPELYQHPPQARHLYSVLIKLSEQNAQIVVATHSPYFISGEGFENVRMFRKVDGATTITRTRHEEVGARIATARGEKPIKASGQLAKIHQALQPGLSEMFFASKIVFVEGAEDSAYLTTCLHLIGLWDEFRKHGCHIIPTDGKCGMLQPLAVAECLQIPVFVAFDADGDKPDNKCGSREMHRKDNTAVQKLCGVVDPNPFPSEIIWGDRLVMWPSEIGRVIEEEIGKDQWEKFRTEADAKYGNAGGLRKNMLHIASSLQAAWLAGKEPPSLKKLCENIMEFAKKK